MSTPVLKISLAVVQVLIAVFGLSFKQKSKHRSLVVLALMLLSLAAQIELELSQSREDAKLQYVGKLAAKSGKASKSVIQFGKSGSFFSFPSNGVASVLSTDLGIPESIVRNNSLMLRNSEGNLLVSAKLTAEDGMMIAELVDNEWKVGSPPRVWDRNYSKDALEVRNDKGEVVLQVELLPDQIRFLGIFWDGKGKGIGFFEAPKQYQGVTYEGGAMIQFCPPGHHFDLSIRPMFKYPSNLHLGEKNE